MENILNQEVFPLKIPRKPILWLLVFLLLLPAAPVVRAENESAVAPYAQQMLQYYLHYQEDARTDIERLLYEMGTIDAAQAESWRSIMDYWSQARKEDFLNPGCLPDGLPDDDSLCIVVLGYALRSDGTMQSELLGRLKVALASARKYPNAYILCTGGGTASQNSAVTEAGQMAAWLKNQGIASDRIITETKSLSTVKNAVYSYQILRDQYPQVQHLAIVTSDYHVSWGYMAFATEISRAVCVDLAPYMDIVSNAAYSTGNQTGSLNSEYSHIVQVSGIGSSKTSKPVLSTLTSLSVQGKQNYQVGDAPDLRVIAGYDSGFSRDVTHLAEISGVETRIPGTRTIQIRYEENGVRLDLDMEIQIQLLSAGETVPEETGIIASTDHPQQKEQKRLSPIPFLISLASLLGLMVLLLRKARKHPRRRRRKMYL